MITRIKIDNFKSLVDFKMEFAQFNCIIGLNSSGKSTTLQAMDFVSQLMSGDIDGWLSMRNWDSSDLNSKLTNKSNIDYTIELEIDGDDVVWTGSFNRTTKSCTKESIVENGKKLLSVESGWYTLNDEKRRRIEFKYQGSILSRLKESPKQITLKKVKDSILHIRSLDLISPELLRSQSRASGGRLGLGGEKLSAYIHEAGPEAKARLTKLLMRVYPHLSDINTKSIRAGWKQLEISESFNSKSLISTARHINDGILRLMAILLQLDIGKAFLLFDEIENGINPELVEFLVDELVNSNDQVMVTTHSPMILNFLEDNVAKAGVTYLYKNDAGATKAIRFFDIPSIARKLEFMGPGEAFIDTKLTELYREIQELELKEA